VGECPGKIVSPKGEAHYKLPFDAIFVPKGYSKRFSELGSEVKNRISHRAIAFRKAGEWLRENGFGKN
jgi:XTP/dITP diphosphohydrolase